MESDTNVYSIEDVNCLQALLIKMARVKKMFKAVDAKTSSNAVCFSGVQLRSKKETREFITNMR